MDSALQTAFILQVHKNPEQVNRFIDQLIGSGIADVYIHIDKKSLEKFKGRILTGPHVKILDQSVDCEWGDISQVDATLMLVREVLASGTPYDFVCLRSGQDLLVKEGFKGFLSETRGKAFFTYRKMGRHELGLMKINWPKVVRKRYTTAHPVRLYRRLLLSLYRKGINIFPNRNWWPNDFSFYKGSQWFSIPLGAAQYMMDFLETNEWYYNYFKNTLVPDESFFHTLLMNSPYKEDVMNNNLYFFKWGEDLSDRNSPQNLEKDDIPLIEGSGQFFARKFDEETDSAVVDYFSSKVRFEHIKKLVHSR
ncbi:hypothetical protein WQ57_18390 [Mesobacillus campisalis]|uniref:Peptide O-xylosyltransferase n=1 Tax=Mesobacillus campisalis TaxID=1408103 RepID=A0A0M2SR12_9BACI|nr:beta-1,6-N-acetylglucosaminyltransferase [Mesobacillus campisalis]KKK36618.1 hypothetical protein WQ57_18390 [Mesobacillus campisalis]